MFLDPKDLRAEAAVAAIRAADVDALTSYLNAHPQLATANIGSHITNGPVIAQTLIAAGADVNAPFVGPAHSETPLHWAASNDDVALIDVLLDAGADIEAGGGVIDQTPLADARAFQQLKAARGLLDRGAVVTLQDAATLGLQNRLEAFYYLDQADRPGPLPLKEDTDEAFWNACHGGQLTAAQFLHDHGADLNILPPWEEKLMPLDAARRSNVPGRGKLVREPRRAEH